VPRQHTNPGFAPGSWGNGYTGDIYHFPTITPFSVRAQASASEPELVLTLPPGTRAFYLYAITGLEGTPAGNDVTVTAQDGTTSGPIRVTSTEDGGTGAKYFGFYTTGDSVLSTLSVFVDVAPGSIVGQFGIAGESGPLPLADGAVAFWRLGERAGRVAADSAGANPGLFTGGFLLGQPGAVPGDTAAAFNGTTGFVQVPDAPALHLGDRFSIEMWVKLASLGRTARGLWLHDAQLFVDGLGQIVFRKPLVDTIARSTATIDDTAGFHHVVVTKDGADVHLYLDGVDVTGPVRNRTITKLARRLTIGGGGTDLVHGTLDEVALYPRALSAAQVVSHYSAG
jgi:hypothetical protein